jgi:hypothetical protein
VLIAGVGSFTLALLSSLIYGVSQIVMGVQLRQTSNTLRSVLENGAA